MYNLLVKCGLKDYYIFILLLNVNVIEEIIYV